jgi:hypothetical protein
MAKTIYITQPAPQRTDSTLNLIIGGVISVAVIGALVYFGRKFYRNNFTSFGFATKIKKYGKSQGTLEVLMKMDKGYLKAWSDAAEDGAETFAYQNKTYWTQGGSAKK